MPVPQDTLVPVGQVMRKTKGRADPQLATELLTKAIGEES
jgi:Asp-tRNA(Asn)/Glu-tRNA(Gln) amidotransferase B subunit